MSERAWWRLGTKLKSGYGNVDCNKVAISIHTDEFPVGIAAKEKKGGGVEFITDNYGYPKKVVEKIEKKLKKTYTKLSLKAVLGQMGYQTMMQRGKSPKIVGTKA